MPTDTNVKQVILNKLTKAQYDAATKNATELYLTPDEPASTTVLGPVKVDGTTITAAVDGTISAVNRQFYATSDTAAATAEKEVSIPAITTLSTGQMIIVQPTVTSTVADSTIKLNNFAAYPMRYNNAAITTDTDSIVWNANYPTVWVFDGTYWRFVAHGVDSNTTYSMNYLNDSGQYKIGGTSSNAQALTRYSLVMQLADKTWQKITNINEAYSTGTSKTVNTNGFLLPTVKYYNTTTIIKGGSNAASGTIRPYSNSVDMRYSTNCGATPGWTTGEYLYLVGTIGADGLFYLDTTTWWTNTLPSTSDGKYYIRIGIVTGDYTCSLLLEHPVYYYDGTKIREYIDMSTVPTMTGATGSVAGAKGLVPAPAATDNNKFLKGDGTWGTIPGTLPGQTGQSGKFLTTDGTDASWELVNGVVDQHDSSTLVKTWTGTKAQYEAIVTKDSNTIYHITDDVDSTTTLLEALYPVGSIYISTNATCPLSTLISGSSWTLVSSGRVLQGADLDHAAGTTIEAGLPEVKAVCNTGNSNAWSNIPSYAQDVTNSNGYQILAGSSIPTTTTLHYIESKASLSSSVYGNSDTVQPAAYVVNIFRRTA